MALLQPDAGVLDLFRALDGFHKAYWRSSHATWPDLDPQLWRPVCWNMFDDA